MLWFGTVECQGSALPAHIAVDWSWLGCDCRVGFLVRVSSVGIVWPLLQEPREFLPWLIGRRCLIQPGTCQYELNLQKQVMHRFALAPCGFSRLVFCRIGCWGFNKILENLQSDLHYCIIDIVYGLDIYMAKSITKQELPSREVGFLAELMPREWKQGVP